MSMARTCPRCSGPLRPPGLMDSGWVCADHGEVTAPYARLPHPTHDAIRQLAQEPGVPLWSALPLPGGWTLAGLGVANDARTGHARGTVVALAGPCPTGGPADLLLVAEEPGLGLGEHVAGMPGLDPGDCTRGAPDATVAVAGHLTPLWRCQSDPDRVAFVGEALGVWLWAVLWPPEAELVLLEQVQLHDLREWKDQPVSIGASSPRLP